MVASSSDDDRDCFNLGGFTGVTQKYSHGRLYNLYLDPKESHSYMIRKLAYIDSFTTGIARHLMSFGPVPAQAPHRRHELTGRANRRLRRPRMIAYRRVCRRAGSHEPGERCPWVNFGTSSAGWGPCSKGSDTIRTRWRARSRPPASTAYRGAILRAAIALYAAAVMRADPRILSVSVGRAPCCSRWSIRTGGPAADWSSSCQSRCGASSTASTPVATRGSSVCRSMAARPPGTGQPGGATGRRTAASAPGIGCAARGERRALSRPGGVTAFATGVWFARGWRTGPSGRPQSGPAWPDREIAPARAPCAGTGPI